MLTLSPTSTLPSPSMLTDVRPHTVNMYNSIHMCNKYIDTLYIHYIELLLLYSQPLTGSVVFSEVVFSVGLTVSVDGAEVTGLGGVAVVVTVVFIVAVVVVNVTTLCNGGNPVLRILSGLVTMYPSGLFSIICVCSNSIVVFVVVVVVVVFAGKITILKGFTLEAIPCPRSCSYIRRYKTD